MVGLYPIILLNSFTRSNNFLVESLGLAFLKILFIYLSERKREQASMHKQGELQAEGEVGSLLSKEPDVGLDDPRTLGS